MDEHLYVTGPSLFVQFIRSRYNNVSFAHCSCVGVCAPHGVCVDAVEPLVEADGTLGALIVIGHTIFGALFQISRVYAS